MAVIEYEAPVETPDELEQIETLTERQRLAQKMLVSLKRQGWCKNHMYVWEDTFLRDLASARACLLGHASFAINGEHGLMEETLEEVGRQVFGVEWQRVSALNDHTHTNYDDIRAYVQVLADGGDHGRARYAVARRVYERTGHMLHPELLV